MHTYLRSHLPSILTALFLLGTSLLARAAGVLPPSGGEFPELMIVGAIATVDPVLAWRQIANMLHSFTPDSQAAMKALKSYLVQHGGNPKLQVIAFDELSDTDVVIADASSKLFALVLKKDSTTATFTKATNHASASSDTAADIVVKTAHVGEVVLTFPKGEPFATGITMQGNTTADGGTGSASNGCKGFAVIGDP